MDEKEEKVNMIDVFCIFLLLNSSYIVHSMFIQNNGYSSL